MRVVIGSAFRNMGGRLGRYFTQVEGLNRHLQRDYPDYGNLRIVAVEGDSRDRTREVLIEGARKIGVELDLVTHNHGYPPFGSVETVERMTCLTDILNAGLSRVEDDDDIMIWVECDLSWSPIQMLGLARAATQLAVICAPMAWAGDAFYDVWGFRGLDGTRFSSFAPYHADYSPERLTELSSAGSCLVMPAHIAREVRAEDPEALVAWCRSARKHGHKIYLVPDFEVRQV